MRRVWTPERVFFHGRERMLLQTPMRDCNRCGLRLGDLTDAELAAASRKRRLSPVDRECPICLGFHVLFAEPAPIEPGDTEPALTVKLLCPGTPAGAAVSGCAEWTRCGCDPGNIDVPSDEWVAFLAAPCPTSPTGEHRHLVERDQPEHPYVGAPQAGTCAYVNAFTSPTAPASLTDHVWGIVAGRPGLYPVEIEVYGQHALVFEPLDITPHVRAEVAPL